MMATLIFPTYLAPFALNLHWFTRVTQAAAF